MSYAQQVVIARAITVALGTIGAIQVADPTVLGLTPRILAWLAIVTVGLGVVSGFLPNVMARAADPSFLADRISELPVHDREALATEMADRAEREPPRP